MNDLSQSVSITGDYCNLGEQKNQSGVIDADNVIYMYMYKYSHESFSIFGPFCVECIGFVFIYLFRDDNKI